MNFTPQTIPSLFFHACDRFASKTAFMTREDGEWINISYAQAEDRVIHLAKCLLQMGVQRQDHIAIFASNCPEWVLLDMAIQSIGCATVPIYPTLNPNQVQFIVDHANVKMVFGENTEKLSQIDHPVKIHIGKENSSGATPWKDFLATPHTLGNKDFFLAMKDAHPDELASIVYTSGTTGEPKGVMLSQRNITSNVQASLQAIPIDENDSSVSFLPLSHMFERTAVCYCILAKGAKMAFCPDIAKVGIVIKEIQPTILVTVPRLLEKIYQKVWDNMATQSKLIQKLFQFAIQLHRKNPLYFLFDKLFFGKVRMQMGGNLRFIVSGGAALSDQIYRFFDQCGFCILQGYGLTETSPVASVNPPSKRKVGTVGLPLQGVEIKISEDEEVLIKGPNIMQGYYKNEQETKRVMTEDGFFKTGDIGYIDDEGYVSITDRIKDIIVTSGGKKIAPLPIENQLVASTWIDQACLIGEGQKTIGALIVPNFEAFSNDQDATTLTQDDMTRLADSSEVHDRIKSVLDDININLAQYQKIKCFKVLSKPFLMENEEITPTLKLRRKIIYDNYASEIQSLFKK